MAPPVAPAQPPNCRNLVPDQSKWTHEEKAKLAKEAKKKEAHRNDQDYRAFFDTSVAPLNQMARNLQLGDVFFLLALSAAESGWLNVENAWLNNLFGITAAGHDNLGFESVQQAADYWTCRYGPYVKGVKNLTDFVQGLKNADYNSVNKDYYKIDRWNDMISSIKKRFEKYGYEKVEDKGIWVLRKKS